MNARRLGRALVLGPPALWLALFFLVPFGIVAKISLSESVTAQPPYRPLAPATLDPAAWRAFLDGLGLDSYRALLAEPLYASAALTSLAMAAGATAILLLLGYPMALGIARAAPRARALLLALVVVPFWTSLLIRVYGLIAILKPGGWLDGAAAALGLPGAPFGLLDTKAAVAIGLVYSYLPFMVLPLYASLDRMDPTLGEAAADLGAPPFGAFLTVTLPLSWPGIVAGSLLCFVPMAGEFIVPDLLGGSDTLTLGRVLWSEFFANRDWPLAAALAISTTALLAAPIVAFRGAEARRAEGRR